MDYPQKSYGRNDEVEAIYTSFGNGKDVAMPGPRRLGKSFLLDRLVDAGPGRGWTTVKVEVAGCTDVRGLSRELCSKIGQRRSGGQRALDVIRQRLHQVLSPRVDPGGPWYQPFLSLDHEAFLSRLIEALNGDADRRWALLIDELPIFLKALHDQGAQGVAAARDFMNLTSRLRADSPKVRWLITGSIGIEPLARAGDYMGVLAKFEPFVLRPLTADQSRDFVQDLARSGRLQHRSRITDVEADALVRTVGWCAAYYLEALAQKLEGEPTDDPTMAGAHVQRAVDALIQPTERSRFEVWEEHLRKHYQDPQRTLAFVALEACAQATQGLTISAVLTGIGRSELTRRELNALLTRLDFEGFVTIADWDAADPVCAIRNPLLRLYWRRFPPGA